MSNISTANRWRPLPFSTFLDELDLLTERPAVEDLRSMLERTQLTIDDVAQWVEFSFQRYQRNLVRGGEQYHALLLCWRPGQRSPIHDHQGSVCAVKVLQGVATETIFEPTPCGQYKAVSSGDEPAGTVMVSEDADVHQMSNLQADGRDLVTLHVYAPPLLTMNRYSIERGESRVFFDPVIEHIDGSGI